MFPEHFVQKNLVWSSAGDVVFDPFSGRGTTVFESLLNGRAAAGCDTNPVAVCLSRAKATHPSKEKVIGRLIELANQSSAFKAILPKENIEFFRSCFHAETLRQLQFLRRHLRWRQRQDDCFLAALVLGSLHGESHRSERYFSNRMPRTISTKPKYSVEWWWRHNYTAPKRDVFKILREMVDFRYADILPALKGTIREGDARNADRLFPRFKRKVSLIITSPPYLDTTHFAEDQWLRLWFLGGAENPQRQGPSDDRHTSIGNYWDFLRESWSGVRSLLRPQAHIVIRMGGRLDFESARQGLKTTLNQGLKNSVRLRGERVTPIGEGQRKIFRPGAVGTKFEYDFHFQLS
jgi:hypothetical protein